MAAYIEPRVLKGFRDYLPAAEIQRKQLIQKLETAFSLFGFVPIDTPVLEYAEILLGKGGGETDKQVYRFRDHGERDVAMRFDLTVPFARFMSQHVEELYLPFRRYHIAKVWRGENTQRGRYREFMQCDFDIVGSDSASADADIVLTIITALKSLEIGSFTVRINHRGLFNRFLENNGISEKSTAILRIVDKLEKIGMEQTKELLASESSEKTADDILFFIHSEPTFIDTLKKMRSLCADDDSLADAAYQRLTAVYEIARKTGVEDFIRLDPSITRGLDYYTGIVFETSLGKMPEIGSVCSGGRYNELANLYTDRKLPGVGASVGLDRLIAALETLDTKNFHKPCPAVLIGALDEALLSEYHSLAVQLRCHGISTEVFPEVKKLPVQFSFAEKKQIPWMILLDSKALAANEIPLRSLSNRETRIFTSQEELVAYLVNQLSISGMEKGAAS